MQRNTTTFSKGLLLLTALALLVACSVPTITDQPPQAPDRWLGQPDSSSATVDIQSLKYWWKNFKDPALEDLVDVAVKNNPDVRSAVAKIAEARGQETTAFAQLLPDLSGKSSADRQRTSFFAPVTGNDYSANFDASYEIDLFGKNREAYKAADFASQASEQDYAWTKLSMIAEVARTYVSTRGEEKQLALANKNLDIEKNTLDLIKRQNRAGGASAFDVERTALQVSQTQANIQEYQRQRNVYFLSLVTLTGLEPDDLQKRLQPVNSIPGVDLTVLADLPANILAHRPDIQAANLRFMQSTSLKESQADAIYPTISISGMFGIAQTVLVAPTTAWSYTGNITMPILDFGRIQGQINAASAREVQAFETWRKAILQGVQDVEMALSNVARIHDQRLALIQARDHAANAWELAQVRYREGDISLLDALDSQKQLIVADSALVDAESSYVTAVIALYKAIGQY